MWDRSPSAIKFYKSSAPASTNNSCIVFFIDMGHPWDFEESMLERKCTLGLSRGIPEPRVESRRGDNDGNPCKGQEIRSGIQEVRNKTNSTCVTHLEFSGGIEKKAVEEATRGSKESKPGEESRRRALDELEAQNASTSMRKIGRHIF